MLRLFASYVYLRQMSLTPCTYASSCNEWKCYEEKAVFVTGDIYEPPVLSVMNIISVLWLLTGSEG